MKEFRQLFYYGFGIIALSFFVFLSWNSKASAVFFEQTSYVVNATTTPLAGNAGSGMLFDCNDQPFATSTPIVALTMRIGRNATNTEDIGLYLDTCDSQQVYASSTTLNVSYIWQDVTFTFSTPVVGGIESFNLNPGGSYYMALSETDVLAYPTRFDGDTNKDLYFRLWDDTSYLDENLTMSGNWVVFKDPPFSPNSEGDDFQVWEICSQITDGNAGRNYSYYLGITYGTSTLTTYSQESQKFSLPEIPQQECVAVQKSNDMDADDWQAQVGLYRYGSIFGTPLIDEFVASSTILNLTITGGSKTHFFTQIAAPEITCSFTISNTGISAVDDTVNGTVNGLCKAAVFLFVPSQESFKRFNRIWDMISSKPPLGWFGNTATEVENLEVSATSTIVSLTGLSVITTPIDTALAFLIGFIFIMWLVHRFRKLDFHN